MSIYKSLVQIRHQVMDAFRTLIGSMFRSPALLVRPAAAIGHVLVNSATTVG